MCTEEQAARQRRIEHQNNLINHRLTWLGVFEAAMFAATARQGAPFLVIAFVGILIAVSIRRGVRKANAVLDEIEPEQKQRSDWLMPGNILPLACIILWVLLMLGWIFSAYPCLRGIFGNPLGT